jgi:hypothetical protein
MDYDHYGKLNENMEKQMENFLKEHEMKTQNIEFKMDMGLTNDEERLLALADDMAAAMSNLNAQNYKEFVDARDRFRKVIAEIVNKTKQNEARIAKMKADILAA